jgi:predicted Rossmann fold nucleotide-binding protein DprA/Smf involved in DNA uptake
MLNDDELAALALTSRLVDSPATPLTPREFWALRQAKEPSALQGMTASAIAAELSVSSGYAERIARLFDRGGGLAIALEKLDHAGIWTITGVGQRYPERLRTRLHDSAPVVLHGVGDASVLDTAGVGVVGSRDISAEGSQVAREIAEGAAKLGLPVVSGAARGVDTDAMNAAFKADGQVVGVLADALERTIARSSMRRGVAVGQICLVTPFTPSAPFSVGNAMGRNKVIYALSRCTIVVASDLQTGGTWSGATEALKNRYGRVASWVGPGSGAGNGALVQGGAVELCDVNRLGGLLDDAVDPPPVDVEPLGHQMAFGFEVSHMAAERPIN